MTLRVRPAGKRSSFRRAGKTGKKTLWLTETNDVHGGVLGNWPRLIRHFADMTSWLNAHQLEKIIAGSLNLDKGCQTEISGAKWDSYDPRTSRSANSASVSVPAISTSRHSSRLWNQVCWRLRPVAGDDPPAFASLSHSTLPADRHQRSRIVTPVAVSSLHPAFRQGMPWVSRRQSGLTR